MSVCKSFFNEIKQLKYFIFIELILLLHPAALQIRVLGGFSVNFLPQIDRSQIGYLLVWVLVIS